MRRRDRPTEATEPPQQLATYRESDWTGSTTSYACPHPPCRYWEAVGRWQDDHPGEDLDVPNGPDVPFHGETL